MGSGSSSQKTESRRSTTPPVNPLLISSRSSKVCFRTRQEVALFKNFTCRGKCHPDLFLSIKDAEHRFLENFPDYGETRHVDALRETEYGRLDADGHVYLDYTGGSLYSKHQADASIDFLLGGVYGNPHSTNPTSQAATKAVEEARKAVLEFFNADPREYECIFTLNASGALRLVGESYPFTKNSHYLYLADNHNSVVGIREFAKSRGATVTYAPVSDGDVRIVDAKLTELLDNLGGNDGTPRLFSFPAQSNLSGVKHSLDWVRQAQVRGWDVILDAAAFVPTNKLDLHEVKPDFVSMSFYKMFGYPTGVGALIAQRSALGRLHRPWFAGGTIEMVSVVGENLERCRGETAEAYEDGTVNYLSIPMVTVGLRFLQDCVGMDAVGVRVACLTQFVLEGLECLKHANGEKVCLVLGPTKMKHRGGTIAMVFQHADGRFRNVHEVEKQANALGISIRTGCFCNPGAMEMKFGLTKDVVNHALQQRVRRGFILKPEYVLALGDNVAEALRVSFGIASNFRDAFVFLRFAASFAESPNASFSLSTAVSPNGDAGDSRDDTEVYDI